jgi:deoxyribodipyrimidine photolyase-related protein
VVSEFCLIEDKRFFSDFNSHKNKLVFHRASMRAYKDKLASVGHKVHYFSYAKAEVATPLRRLSQGGRWSKSV